MTIRVLIIIPCYNEAESLPKLAEELKQLAAIEGYEIVPLVVNDCSKDPTAIVARTLQLKLIDLPNNLGIGGAVQSGIKYAQRHQFDYAVQMDGDGQHPPSELIKLLNAAAATKADVIIGSRFLEKDGFQSTFLRRLGIQYFHFLNKLLTRKNIYDSTSGYRMLGKKAIDLACRYYPDDYPEPESLVFFSRAGLQVIEVPVVMRLRQGGVSSIRGFKTFEYMVKVTLSMIFSYIRKL